MDKSPDAFRTISEVADHLDTPAHVLRFWESRFPQIRPVKRAGGRRYYRPSDVALLAGIKRLLHDDGLTIRGVQKILREQGVRHVSALGGVGADALHRVVEASALSDLDDGSALAPEASQTAVFPEPDGPQTVVDPSRMAPVHARPDETGSAISDDKLDAELDADLDSQTDTPAQDARPAEPAPQVDDADLLLASVMDGLPRRGTRSTARRRHLAVHPTCPW
jgi:resuscitation-promoting factor RpfA